MNKSGEFSGFVKPNLPSKCTWHLRSKASSPHHHDIAVKKEKIHDDVLHAVGDTPMIRLNKIPLEYELKCELVAKCEFFNPGGSVKDRIGIRMIEEAERQGKLKPGATIIEPTSGNTGIAVALVCAVKGYRCIILMPEKMSIDKHLTLKALGAEIVRTKDVDFDHPESNHCLAQKMAHEIPNSIVLNQYRNPANCMAHYDITAEEILSQCDNKIDMVVMGGGTGATITGIGRKLKEKCPHIKVIGVEPYGSIYSYDEDSLSSADLQPFDVEGIGHNFVPTTLDRSVVDKWIKVQDRDTFLMARKLIKDEGLLCGGSSGSSVMGAVMAAKELREGQRCVVVLPDGIRNYMTKFITDPWMLERNFINIDKQMRIKHWWWDTKAVSLKLDSPMTIPEKLPVEDAIQVMYKKNCDQLTVVDNDGAIKGIVKLEKIKEKVADGKDISKSTVSDLLTTKFKKVTVDATLGRVFTLLNDTNYVLIVHNQQICSTKKIFEEKEFVIGIVTQINLMEFITNRNNVNCKLNSLPLPFLNSNGISNGIANGICNGISNGV